MEVGRVAYLEQQKKRRWKVRLEVGEAESEVGAVVRDEG